MKKITFIIFLFFIGITSFGNEKDKSNAEVTCSLTTYHQIIKININQDESIIKQTNCSSDVKQVFINFIESAEGKLGHQHLSRYFKDEFDINITLSPQLFSVKKINDLIQDSLEINNGVIQNVTSLFPQASINLDKNQKVSITCTDCKTPGSKNISIFFNQREHWLNANLLIKKSAYMLSTNIVSLNNKLTRNQFKLKSFYDKGNRNYFSDIKNIRFYRLNRFIKEGEILKINDLSPRVLVKYGRRVKVLYKNESIKLSLLATSKANGRFGEYIELINPKSKKKILAKITDYNKAEVEL